MKPEKVRLQKFLSQQGVCSRRAAEDLMVRKQITVNGQVATLGDKVDGSETIVIEGKKLTVRTPETVVLAFYKPIGVETTLSQVPGGQTLLDFDFGPERVFPIGRLDKDSHGLLLLTNDGELANHLAHPRYQHEKEYLVAVKGEVTAERLTQLATGVMIGDKKTSPCHVEQVETNVLRFVLREGRNRQIRKMCEAVGLTVKDLLRVRIGSLWLGEMKPGRHRFLSKAETNSLQKPTANS